MFTTYHTANRHARSSLFPPEADRESLDSGASGADQPQLVGIDIIAFNGANDVGLLKSLTMASSIDPVDLHAMLSEEH